MKPVSHHSIREAIRSRIEAGEWGLGELIPPEADFAEEYGCARTTVNRALQALAEDGIVERKRKGGTRVRPTPLHEARLRIPIIREQVESRGAVYTHRLLHRTLRPLPGETAQRMHLTAGQDAWYLETLHLADDAPFAFERRWVNPATVPELEAADLAHVSANEWLIRTVPFTTGDVALSASTTDATIGKTLGIGPGTALFTMQRTTWLDAASVTSMWLFYAPGYRLEFPI